jgi:hypothetical protein
MPQASKVALVHYDPGGQELLGAWVDSPSGPESFYPAGGAPEEYATQLLDSYIPGVSFDDAAASIARVSPYVAWWAAVPREPSDVTAKDVYDRVNVP